jgi:transposase
MLINANPGPQLSERQRRFLDAYRQRLAISPAARLAGVHRATVYRWLRNSAFEVAFQGAAEMFFREHRAKVVAEEEAREQWRRQRELERRPMRCYYLARAREAKRR